MAMVGMMGPNTYITLNNATRDRLGTFVEWERQWDRAWSTLLGVRNDVVWMDTGDVAGYNNAVGGMAGVYAADAAAFNARDHARQDVNFDVTAMARYGPKPHQHHRTRLRHEVALAEPLRALRLEPSAGADGDEHDRLVR